MKTVDPLITEEMIIQKYLNSGIKKDERAVREIWRVMKEYAKDSARKGFTKIKMGRFDLISDIYLKGQKQEYEAEHLQYFMNNLYFDKRSAYRGDYLMNSKYRENNIEEIVEDVENFFKNPPFKNKKTKEQ